MLETCKRKLEKFVSNYILNALMNGDYEYLENIAKKPMEEVKALLHCKGLECWEYVDYEDKKELNTFAKMLKAEALEMLEEKEG